MVTSDITSSLTVMAIISKSTPLNYSLSPSFRTRTLTQKEITKRKIYKYKSFFKLGILELGGGGGSGMSYLPGWKLTRVLTLSKGCLRERLVPLWINLIIISDLNQLFIPLNVQIWVKSQFPRP